ncbi:TIGR03905 family TSCPD domain-containing protein [Clostridiaceae bacterium UIB06]|uniref:ribonucleoside-diphosphate reductase n=1 Tax=Clostridium thailandense TaxID=2794346 RepID=A0A949TSK0_9CLOT|nr:TIGR03905 family TSCPD domain-containing protein [Clostridium thailandense]MBV7274587.1 TIGR03905 family TSCPD domain-containing protein [Clostridium thailandense]MCH5138024.1 TIGR03905 family TSCPD domain-containing protein [Clostridiaceae bacterium UIB06]
MYNYKTSGVCSSEINFDIVDNKITNVCFIGGCNGNLQGLAKLLEGLEPEEAIKKLEGISCDGKATSCPDQFAKALKGVLLKK